MFRASGNGPVAPVLAGPVSSQGKKIKVHFYKKQVIKKSASMIFGLVRLIILGYNGRRRHMKKCTIIGCPHIILTRYSVVQVRNTVAMWFLDLLGLKYYSTTDRKRISAVITLSAAPAFD